MPTYYRLFYMRGHFADWEAEKYFSYYRAIPGAWIQLFAAGVRAPEKFPRKQMEGHYTENAVHAYLALAGNYRPGERWSDKDLEAASQLDGVCAFSDVESVLKFADGARYSGMCVAEFEGVWISDIPESGEGMTGALVKPIRKISLRPYEEFRQEKSAEH
jgi:hypothetical protein